MHTKSPQKLWPLPSVRLFSVGRSTAEKLTAARIRTIGDLAQADLAYIQRLTGVKLGKLIHDYANGIDDAPVLSEPEAVKGYGNSVTLEQDVTTQAQANQILLALCDSVASRMRADSRRCACVTVTIRGNDFRNRSHQRRLPEPTDVTAELYAMSRTLFSELWDGVTPLRLLGVTLNDLCGDDAVQLSLFRDEKTERAASLTRPSISCAANSASQRSHAAASRTRPGAWAGNTRQSSTPVKNNQADRQMLFKNSAQSSGNVRAGTASGATSGISASSRSPAVAVIGAEPLPGFDRGLHGLVDRNRSLTCDASAFSSRSGSLRSGTGVMESCRPSTTGTAECRPPAAA